MQNKLWCDLKSDCEKAEYLRSGRAVETGIIAPAMVDEIVAIYEERAAKPMESTNTSHNKPSVPCVHCGKLVPVSKIKFATCEQCCDI